MHRLQRLAAETTQAVAAGCALPAALAATWAGHPELTARDRAFIQDASYGVMRHLGWLEAVLAALASKGSRDERVRHLLLVALYQLAHGRASAHVVVDHAVRAVAGQNAAARGFAIAVLRRYLRERAELERQATRTPRGRFSYPEWWIERIRRAYPNDYAAILDAGNVRPPLTLRVNRRKLSRDHYLQRLHAAQIEATPIGELGVILAQPRRVESLPGFSEGWVSVQDYGAQLAAPLLEARDGMRVLDACAAPGGKSAHILELAELDLTCLDQDGARLTRLKDNLDRGGFSAHIVQGDAGDPATWWDGKPFDRILADVPCSASGVVRRHPDAKWLRREADIAAFAAQQARILRALWPCLKPGGWLLYATCSLFEEENESVVAGFCAAYAEAQRLPLAFPDGGAQLLPSATGAAHNQDGFFYALIAKSI